MSPPYKLQPPIPGSIGGAAVGVTPGGVLVYLNCDVDGNLIASSSPPATVTPIPFVAFGVNELVAHVGASTLLSAACSNSGTSTVFFQVFDRSSAPAANEVPILEFFVVAGAQSLVGSDFLNGLAFTTGITFGVSTTSGTYVAATAETSNIQGTYAT